MDSMIAPTLESIYVEFASDRTTADARAWADQHVGADWLVEPAWIAETERSRAFDFTPPARLGMADAWDTVYWFRDQPGVVNASPDFEVGVVVPGDVAPPAPDGLEPLGGGDAHGSKDSDWAPKRVNTFDAWALKPPAAHGKIKGEGIRIGHPDSGYVPHVELSDRYLSKIGYDFIDEEIGGLEDRKHGAHGLATASVICSPDNQSDKPTVTGVAPLAEVLPYRVTKRHWKLPAPVLLGSGSRRLRRAIDWATNVHDCQVVSISLGWFGSDALYTSVKRAYDANVILVGAAGNTPAPTVVWPGQYREVVCVGGTDAKDRPWDGACRGSTVDLSGPAYSVYRARPGKSKPDLEKHDTVEPSKGTSYATAMTAGAAALWLAYHGHQALLDKYKGKMTLGEVFRRLVKATVRTPDEWDDDYGEGILDIEALLKAPLINPDLEPLGADDPIAQGFEKLERVFETVEPDQLRERVARLLDVDPSEVEQRIAGCEDEVLAAIYLDVDARRYVIGVGDDDFEQMGPPDTLHDGLSNRLADALS